MHNPSREDFDPFDYRKLCPLGAELVVFVANPCVANAHGPKAYHYRDSRTSSCIDYEGPDYVGEYWPNELASLTTAAGLDPEDWSHEELTRLICDHLGLPPLDRVCPSTGGGGVDEPGPRRPVEVVVGAVVGVGAELVRPTVVPGAPRSLPLPARPPLRRAHWASAA